MTLLHEGRSLELFTEVCSLLAQAKVPQTVVDIVWQYHANSAPMSASSHSWTMHLTSKVDWVGACNTILEEDVSMLAWASIWGRVWNPAGLRRPVCDVLERLARIEDPQDFQKSTGVASGHPPFVCQTFGEDINQAPGASRQKKKNSTESHFWVGISLPLCVCSRQPLVESRF